MYGYSASIYRLIYSQSYFFILRNILYSGWGFGFWVWGGVLGVRLGYQLMGFGACGVGALYINIRSEERRVGKECRSRWSPYH